MGAISYFFDEVKNLACILLVSACFVIVNVNAQNQLLTQSDVVKGIINPELKSKYSGICWNTDNTKYSWIDNNRILQQIVGQSNAYEILSVTRLNNLLAKMEKDTVRNLPASFQWVTSNCLFMQIDTTAIFYQVSDSSLVAVYKLPSDAENLLVSGVDYRIVYTTSNAVYSQSIKTDRYKVIESIENGLELGKVVSRNEFGIEQGLFLSPNGAKLAFYRKDERNIECYPLVDIAKPIAQTKPIRYPMAGRISEKIALGIYSFQNQSICYLQTDTAGFNYITSVTWSPDARFIYAGLLNRAQDTLQLCQFDGQTGKKLQVLFTETHAKYVEPEHSLHFVSDDQFVWLSKRSGYQHAYLYQTTGRLIKQLSTGAFNIEQIAGFNAQRSELLVLASVGSPLDRQFAKINVRSGKVTTLTSHSGVHKSTCSQNGNWVIDQFETPFIAKGICLIKTDASYYDTLLKIEDPLIAYKPVTIYVGTIKANDGVTDLYTRMILPANFDSTRRYPVIIYVYGGPHVQLIQNRWLYGARLWDVYMAQQGYVVFTLDNRGSEGRSIDFENITHRRLGTIEMQDQLTGVDYLRGLPFTDKARIGVYGWSFGGFMATSLMLTYPEVFKVGVAGGPVIDWSQYEVMYGERYMDMPAENAEGYAQSNLCNKAANLKGRLLMVHGAQDPVVVWQHSLRFIDACIAAKTYPDYFVYPEHEHNVTGPEREHLNTMISRYFNDFLK